MTISILQSLDPVGVGARNIRESLLIQMRVQTDYNQLAYVMVEKHLEDIATKRFRKIAKTYDGLYRKFKRQLIILRH